MKNKKIYKIYAKYKNDVKSIKRSNLYTSEKARIEKIRLQDMGCSKVYIKKRNIN